MNKADLAVIAAMGDKYREFLSYARLAYHNPETRLYAEAKMAKLLETLTPGQRLALRQALREAGPG
jgi:hypothetical protein